MASFVVSIKEVPAMCTYKYHKNRNQDIYSFFSGYFYIQNNSQKNIILVIFPFHSQVGCSQIHCVLYLFILFALI